jgi:hypothetical protein
VAPQADVEFAQSVAELSGLCLLQELQARNPHENHGALEQGLRDKWRAGITEAQIVDAVEIDLLQPDC